jgi:Protein of unknown function (DUF3040)
VLNDHERKTLREVERQLVVEDPEFIRSFATRAQRLERRHPEGELAKIFLVAALLLGALMLMAGSPGGALAFAAVAVLIWVARQHANDTHSRSPEHPPTGTENDHY